MAKAAEAGAMRVVSGAASDQAADVSCGSRLRTSLTSINLFPQYIMVDDAETQYHGWRMSWIFLSLFVLSTISSVTSNALNPVTTKTTILKPTYGEYMPIVQYAPNCACTNYVRWGDVAQMNLPLQANLSANACSALMPLFNDAAIKLASPPGSQPAGYNNNTVALALSVLHPVLQGCEVLRSAQATYMNMVDTTYLGDFALTPEALQQSVDKTALSALQGYESTAQTLIASIVFMSSTNLAGYTDLSYGATQHSPPNCSCSGLLDRLPLPVDSMTKGAGCTFHIAFDTRTNSSNPDLNPDNMWSCVMAANAQKFPLELLSAPFYQVLGLSPPFDKYAFVPSPNASVVQDLWSLPGQVCFQRVDANTFNYNALQPGLVTFDHRAYYDACRPSSCVYTETGRPSTISAFTTTLGTLSGLQTVLMLLVGRLYPRLVQRKAPRAPTMVTLEEMPDKTGAGGEGDASGSTPNQTLVMRKVPTARRRGTSAGPARPLPQGPRPAPSSTSADVGAGFGNSGASTPRMSLLPSATGPRSGLGAGSSAAGARVVANPLSAA